MIAFSRMMPALALLTACNAINLTPHPSRATLTVNPGEIHVQRRDISYFATIPFVFVNTTPEPVSKASCGFSSPLLEKNVDGKWVIAYAPFLLGCRNIPDLSIASGKSLSGAVRVIAAEPGHNTGPEWSVGAIDGTYRLRWDFIEGTVANANGAHKVVAVSNAFRMMLSEDRLSFATQLVVVTTAGWDSTVGELRRFYRDDPYSYWKREGAAIPIVVGRTGLAWGVGFDSAALGSEPHKHEGDGRSPAGVFAIDTVFGFASADSMRGIHLPYLHLTVNSECVDDTASIHYNTVVERDAVPSVDWQSAEHMLTVQQYRLGFIVGYNATPPVKARGSCIFFHIWKGPRSTTVGCTAMDASELEHLVRWLDQKWQPVVVQIPASVYPRLRDKLGLPFFGL